MKTQLKNQMSRQLLTIPETATITEAYHVMVNEWIRHLPVTSADGEWIVGIVSDRDLLGAEDDTWPVNKVMSSHVRSCDVSTPIRKIVHSMIDNKISSYLITKKDEIHGIVTTEDMLILLSQLLSKEEESDQMVVQKWITNPVTQNTIHMLSQAGI